MFDCWTTVGLIAATLIAIYAYVVRNNDYWAKRGIAFIKPVPFFGNMLTVVLHTRSVAESVLVIFI